MMACVGALAMRRRRHPDAEAIARLISAGFAGGQNGRVGDYGVVHLVHLEEGMAGIQLPAPACRIGLAGWRPERMAPTRDTVSCGRCMRLRVAEPMLAAAAAGGTQLTLVD